MNASRMILTTLAGLVIGLAVAFFVISATRPSNDELQAAALDEMGLSSDLASSRLIGPILDQMTDKIGDRMVAETRSSVIAGVLAGVVAAAGVAGAASWISRPRPEPETA